MTRSGDDYVRGLRDGRTVLLNGERVADVTRHAAFKAAIRTVANLYDLANDTAHRDLMTYPSPRDGHPVNNSWLVPRTRDDLVKRRQATKFWADASYGFLGRSPDHVASFFAGFAGSPEFLRAAANSLAKICCGLPRKPPTKICTSAMSSCIRPLTAQNRRTSSRSRTFMPAPPPSATAASSFVARKCSARVRSCRIIFLSP